MEIKTAQSPWHGRLEISYENRNNSTIVTSAYSQAPFKIQRPFYPEGKSICHSVILHTAGGLVGGDRLSQNIELQENCQSLITTPAATKIYRNKGNRSQQEITIKIGKNSCLELLPQENIIFNGAYYAQKYCIELEENARYLGWEINRFGRTARGEKFIEGDWKSSTEIWQDGKAIWIDRQWLPGKEEVFYNPNGLAGQPVTGTLCWIGDSFSEDLLEKIYHLSDNGEIKGKTGVTTLLNGILCRYRGSSTTEAKKWFLDVWELLRLNYLGRTKIKPRVWQI